MLLLRAHDRLERRVARLVDRVADGDDGGQLDGDGVVAVLGLALAAQLAVLDVELDDLRERGHLEVIGHDGTDRVALAIGRLLAEQHEVGRLRLEHLGERIAGRADVRPGERVVGEVHRAVGSEGDGLVERAARLGGRHGHGDYLLDVDGATLADLHGCLDGVSVELVRRGLARAVEALEAGSMRFSTAASGTSLTRTQIFTESFSLAVNVARGGAASQAPASRGGQHPTSLTDESIAYPDGALASAWERRAGSGGYGGLDEVDDALDRRSGREDLRHAEPLELAMSSFGIVPPTTSTTSSAPSSLSSAAIRGTSVICAPDRIDNPTASASSCSTVSTICSGV